MNHSLFETLELIWWAPRRVVASPASAPPEPHHRQLATGTGSAGSGVEIEPYEVRITLPAESGQSKQPVEIAYSSGGKKDSIRPESPVDTSLLRSPLSVQPEVDTTPTKCTIADEPVPKWPAIPFIIRRLSINGVELVIWSSGAVHQIGKTSLVLPSPQEERLLSRLILAARRMQPELEVTEFVWPLFPGLGPGIHTEARLDAVWARWWDGVKGELWLAAPPPLKLQLHADRCFELFGRTVSGYLPSLDELILKPERKTSWLPILSGFPRVMDG